MSKIYEILSKMNDEDLGKIKEMMTKNDNEGVKNFLDKYMQGIEKTKVQSSTRPEVEEPKKTQASVPFGFEFFRYNGTRCKNIPYHGVTICLQPKDIK